MNPVTDRDPDIRLNIIPELETELGRPIRPSDLHKHFKCGDFVDVFQMCRAFGIQFKLTNLHESDYSITFLNGWPIFWIHESHPMQHARLICAHLLALLVQGAQYNTAPSNMLVQITGMNPQSDIYPLDLEAANRADRFAVELLVPPESLKHTPWPEASAKFGVHDQVIGYAICMMINAIPRPLPKATLHKL